MFDEFEEKANRAALIVANQRYHEQLAPWVGNSAIRLAFVQKEVGIIINNAVEETGANAEYVYTRFQQKLAEDVVNSPRGTGDLDQLNPTLKDQGVKRDDPLNTGGVEGLGLEESLDIPKQDLNDQTQKKVGPADDTTNGLPQWQSSLKDSSTWPKCFRCSKTLNPVYAAVSPVCKTCTEKLALGEGIGTHDLEDSDHDIKPKHDPTQTSMFECSVCRQLGRPVRGTHEELVAHVRDTHQDVLNKLEGEPVNRNFDDDHSEEKEQYHPEFEQPRSNVKIADVPQDESDTAEVAPNNEQPADRFDDIIQDLADRAAAQQFSQPSAEEINQLATLYGTDTDTIKNSLYATATFGKYMGVNGQIGKNAQTPHGYQEINMGGQVNPQQALVPTDVVVQKVADEMGMSTDLVYNMVKDKYGADLPDKYHASVSGEHHFFLPQEIAANQVEQPEQQPQQQPVAPPDPSQGMQGMAPMQPSSPVMTQ